MMATTRSRTTATAAARRPFHSVVNNLPIGSGLPSKLDYADGGAGAVSFESSFEPHLLLHRGDDQGDSDDGSLARQRDPPRPLLRRPRRLLLRLLLTTLLLASHAMTFSCGVFCGALCGVYWIVRSTDRFHMSKEWEGPLPEWFPRFTFASSSSSSSSSTAMATMATMPTMTAAAAATAGAGAGAGGLFEDMVPPPAEPRGFEGLGGAYDL